MRKWMRERMKRRKKKTSAAGGEAGGEQLEPLQPKYQEDGTAAGAEDGDEPDSDAPEQGNDTGDDSSQKRMVVETQPDSPNTPPGSEAIPPRPGQRQPKGTVVLAIGLPGSGKTTWFRRRGVTPLSSDMLRNILFDDIEEQRYQGLVFSTLRSLLRARLIAKMPWNYVDATNLSKQERRQWIKMARSFGYDVQAVYFDVPLEVCLERNSRRDRRVAEEVLRRMAAKLTPPTFDEGFGKIIVVRVKKSDSQPEQ